MGEKRDVKSIWQLPTDSEGFITKEYLEERNKNAIEIAYKLGIIKAEA